MATQHVEILGRNYAVPDLHSESIAVICKQIERWSRSARRTRRRASRQRKSAAINKRVGPLKDVVGLFEECICQLRINRDDYVRFLARLSEDIKSAFARRADELRQLEGDRSSLLATSLANRDETTASYLVEEQQRHQSMAAARCKAALHIARRVGMCERALVTVGYAHETQRTALARILDRMDGLVQMPALSGRIPQIEEDVARVVDVALELEDYVKESFRMLELSLEEVAVIESRLAFTIQEIRYLSVQTVASATGYSPPVEQNDEDIMSLLLSARLKQERLQEILGEQPFLSATGIDEGERETSVEVRLDNARLLLDSCLESIRAHLGVNPSGSSTTSEAWKNYQPHYTAYQLAIDLFGAAKKMMSLMRAKKRGALLRVSPQPALFVTIAYVTARAVVGLRERSQGSLETQDLVSQVSKLVRNYWSGVGQRAEDLFATILQCFDRLTSYVWNSSNECPAPSEMLNYLKKLVAVSGHSDFLKALKAMERCPIPPLSRVPDETLLEADRKHLVPVLQRLFVAEPTLVHCFRCGEKVILQWQNHGLYCPNCGWDRDAARKGG